ncbi:MAG TPA: ABC transporter permease [Actinomycetes bacterium]|nr:ABC transporter permease [Actinomycetes bacterium]
MSALTGTGGLLRLALRRDRLQIPLWALWLFFFVVATASSFDQLYKTAAEQARFAADIATNGAFKVLYGNLYDVSTGGFTAWRCAGGGVIFAGLMSLLLAVRHTRGDEEAGHSELLGATVVGRYASIASALLVVVIANLAAGLLVVLGLTGIGLDAVGSVALALGIAAGGCVFGAVGAVTAQVASSGRAANGIAGILLGVAFILRAVGDSGSGTLSWLSPNGWAQAVRAYGDERWWVLALPVAAVAVLAAIAFALVSRRDHGLGLLPSRPGPASAPASLGSPLGLAWRIQRGSVVGWAFGFLVVGAVCGLVASDVADVFGDNQQYADALRRLGGPGGLVDAFLGAILGLLAVVAAGYMIQAVLRIRAEEAAYRAEEVLATSVSRWRWAGGHVACGALGTVLIMLAAGLGLGLVHGLRTGDLGGQLPRLLEAALAQVPAAWILGGLAFALTGLLPRLVAIAWAVFAVYFMIGQVGEAFDLPGWVLDLSPFRHAPQFPLTDLRVAPLLALLAASLPLTAGGMVAMRRRDIA